MSDIFVGVLGGIFILLSWFFETEESVRNHKSLLDLRYAAIYFTGLFFLAVYAYNENEQVFFWLEIAIMTVVLFEILYTIHSRLGKRKVKRRKRSYKI